MSPSPVNLFKSFSRMRSFLTCIMPSSLTSGELTSRRNTTSMLRVLVLSVFVASVTAQVSEIAFSAGVTKDLTIQHAEVVKFDRTFTNIGNAYNYQTGVFTCPTSGIYVFQFHTLAHQDKASWLELYHNANYIASAYGHTSNDYDSAGNSVILKLTKGDTVYIKAVDGKYGAETNIYGQSNEVYSTFSGYLIAPVFEEIPAVGK